MAIQQKQKIIESQKGRIEQEERIKNAKEKNDSELQRKRKVRKTFKKLKIKYFCF